MRVFVETVKKPNQTNFQTYLTTEIQITPHICTIVYPITQPLMNLIKQNVSASLCNTTLMSLTKAPEDQKIQFRRIRQMAAQKQHNNLRALGQPGMGAN